MLQRQSVSSRYALRERCMYVWQLQLLPPPRPGVDLLQRRLLIGRVIVQTRAVEVTL